MKWIDMFFCTLMDMFMILSKCLLVIMTLIICVSVFFRYVLNSGLSWTDEVAMLFFVWFGFISVAYGVQHKLHIGVELFYNMFPEKVQKVLMKVNYLLVCIVGILLLTNGIQLMESTMTNYMTATRWPTAVRYCPVAISGFLMAYFSFAHFIGYETGKYKEERLAKKEAAKQNITEEKVEEDVEYGS